MDEATRWAYLDGLPSRLAAAVGPAELVAATAPPDGVGIVRRLEPDVLWVGADRPPSPFPRVVLSLDPPVDARALCRAWAIARPVAVSGDVHQRRWGIVVAGEDLPDPYQRRIAAQTFATGRWEVAIDLAGRPSGALPGVVVGASPAHDVLERGGAVVRLAVSPAASRSEVVRADHPDARALLDAMAALHPAWHAGWDVLPDTVLVVIHADGRAAAGAAIADVGRGMFAASRVCVQPAPDAGAAGAALLLVLESVALGRGGDRLRLDGSVFLHGATVPWERHGYVVGPPYAGDADDPVWVERDLRWEPD